MSTPSPSELKLLKLLWQHERLSAREIHDATAAATDWSYSTTRKTLDRMVEKGLIETAPVHGIKTFAASRSKLEIMAGLISDFARNVLDTDQPLPAATFAPQQGDLLRRDQRVESPAR